MHDATASAVTRSTALYRSAIFGGHDNPHHPENQRRLDAIERRLAEDGLLSGRPDIPFADAPLATLERVHNPWYVERIDRLAMGGGAWLDADTYIGPDSYDIALQAAGAAVAAVEAALSGSAPRGFALVRPPGHHATAERGMGFCLFNNVAAGAARALELGAGRVAIVDWDVHHGNGTQDIFYRNGEVLFCSVHQYPFYPGTGDRDEQGDGEGEGRTVNVPLLAGQGDDGYLRVFDAVFLPFLRAFEPEIVLVSAGFDAHARDPLGGMRVTEAGFVAMTRRLAEIADRTAGGRLVAVLEGGYDADALARSVAATLRALDGMSDSAV
jgi:acetoin utilization deacetylase AcuC-like enzyme